MPRGVRKNPGAATARTPAARKPTTKKATSTKAQPAANKVTKTAAKKPNKKATLYQKVINHNFQDPPKFKPSTRSRYLTKATNRISGKSAHYRKTHPEEFYNVWPKTNAALQDDGTASDEQDGIKRFEKLPPEVRKKIWHQLVVDENGFVWPNSEASRMQPDIARTCKLFREEILPIYYASNTFAWDLECHQVPNGKGLSPVVSFALALSTGPNWLKHIKNWTFGIDVGVMPETQPDEEVKDKKMVWETLLYKLTLPKTRSKKSPIIEVHRDAVCIKNAKAAPCVLTVAPESLYEGVVQALWEGDGKTMTSKVMHNLTAYLEGAAEKMLGSRCDRDPLTDRFSCPLLDSNGNPAQGSDIADHHVSEEQNVALLTMVFEEGEKDLDELKDTPMEDAPSDGPLTASVQQHTGEHDAKDNVKATLVSDNAQPSDADRFDDSVDTLDLSGDVSATSAEMLMVA